MTYECVQCGETRTKLMMKNGGYGRSKKLCKACHNRNTIRRGQKNRDKLIEYAGGRCIRCGYSKCFNAMDFHHTDPEQKDPAWRSMRYWGFEKAKKEIEKCELLCSNCHREEHARLNEERLMQV